MTALIADKPRTLFFNPSDPPGTLSPCFPVASTRRASNFYRAPTSSRVQKQKKTCPLLLAARSTAFKKARARAIPSGRRSTRDSSSHAVSAIVTIVVQSHRGAAGGGSSLGLGLALAAGPLERSACSVPTAARDTDPSRRRRQSLDVLRRFIVIPLHLEAISSSPARRTRVVAAVG